MTFSAYDPDAVRLLSAVLSDALDIVRRSAARPLTEAETSDFTKRITDNLLKRFNLGERAPSALRGAALREILSSPDQSAKLVEPTFFFAGGAAEFMQPNGDVNLCPPTGDRV
jgi:hypothetical protein